MVKDFFRKYISTFARVCFCLLAFALAAKVIALCSPVFADFFNRYIASVPRSILSYLTAIFPFSVAEAFVIAAIPLIILALVYCGFVVFKKGKGLRLIFDIVGIICLLFAVFIINMSIAYDVTPIEEKMDLDTDITAYDLYEACEIIIAELEELEDKIVRDEAGAAIMPYSFSQMNKKLNDAYKKLDDDLEFLIPLYVPTKKIALSKPFTYTQISGVYTVFTGEANINVNLPAFVIPSTAAHEMAHQRGIAPEDEANFVAFMVCYNSDDPFIRYSGLMEMLDYLAGALLEADANLYVELSQKFLESSVIEYLLFSLSISKYNTNDNTVGEIATAANDAYLKSQGQTAGVESYDLVASLATAYLLK